MLSLAVWNFLGTEMPYPSSHTLMHRGTPKTAAAFMVSQNMPSEVEASPMVPKATSSPSRENPLTLNPAFFMALPHAR